MGKRREIPFLHFPNFVGDEHHKDTRGSKHWRLGMCIGTCHTMVLSRDSQAKSVRGLGSLPEKTMKAVYCTLSKHRAHTCTRVYSSDKSSARETRARMRMLHDDDGVVDNHDDNIWHDGV